jgi:hypothetical protein
MVISVLMAKENSRATTERMAITQRTIIKATPFSPRTMDNERWTVDFKPLTSNLKPPTSNLPPTL